MKPQATEDMPWGCSKTMLINPQTLLCCSGSSCWMAGSVLPWSVAAGEPVFPQLKDTCHRYDSIVPPVLGDPVPVCITWQDKKMHQEQKYGPRPQLGVMDLMQLIGCCGLQKAVCWDNLHGWGAPLVPVAMAHIWGRGSWRGR